MQPSSPTFHEDGMARDPRLSMKQTCNELWLLWALSVQQTCLAKAGSESFDWGSFLVAADVLSADP
jgi:hypothetical protein